MQTEWILIYWTCSSKDEAQSIITDLLDQSLIVCANISSPIQSMYKWKGIIEKQTELQITLKAHHSLFQKIQDFICLNTAYEIPEIIAVNVSYLSPGYAIWLRENSLLLD
ncbi:Divalent-cation tolerance protein cutA-like protein [Candidatus Clavichlamydia salmonicola]|uniref:divalent-cation tolerance protein CutA n=1 Tax=Candidatus Clavichlamydia salmonicola TaxID=469812 RepID=UPI001891865A|nr:divalent-cation tolerance protein CutA [Candidatus Clavichlamydia salmonicola]MBF5050493.1 Divalent-cation tolerance protein cutA-like protein [Candidatus Clavichlamydia salmonicola]